jgi:two-component system sensor histidine kinase PilS (NtrC family)
MLVEQGYLSPLTSPGYADRLAVHRRLSRESTERLVDTQRALEVQDRLVAAGLLALGASHEYRNVLAALRASAGRALACPDAGEKDRFLRLVLEHARAGEESATALLERLGRDGREMPARLALCDLLERIARTVRPVARHAGVRLLVDAGDGFVVRARPGELAQVLLNLARNAIGSYVRRGPGAGEPLVRLSARADGCRVFIEAIDNAGGVSPAQVPRLFRLGRSGRGSTGVGLYLARCLAERNGGTLSYRRVDGGSCFTLALPLAGRARTPTGPVA